MLKITKKVFDNIKTPNYIIFNSIIRTSFTEVHDELKHKSSDKISLIST